MNDASQDAGDLSRLLHVAAGADRSGEKHGLGISTIDFKVTAQDNPDVFILENTFHARGGPARHLHFDQEEWFYAAEGDFLFEVGAERFVLQPGGSILAPRQVPHVWAFVGETRGRIVIAFLPPGLMESFFRKVTQSNAMPAPDPGLWRAHGMELLGPPLQV